jgi:transposase
MKKRKTKVYTKEFKQEAIKLALQSPHISDTAERLGLPSSTLVTWIKNLKNAKETDKNAIQEGKPNFATLLEENRRLHKELERLSEEKEILKKAAAYFAQHQK